MVVESFGSGSIRQQRTSWEIENGPDEAGGTGSINWVNGTGYCTTFDAFALLIP